MNPVPNESQKIFPKPSSTLEELARMQGVQPIRTVAELKGSPWTEEEGANDDFDAWLRKIRNDGNSGRDLG